MQHLFPHTAVIMKKIAIMALSLLCLKGDDEWTYLLNIRYFNAIICPVI
jgi:hypothetical protein